MTMSAGDGRERARNALAGLDGQGSLSTAGAPLLPRDGDNKAETRVLSARTTGRTGLDRL